jgi:hypothetical protein
MKPGLAGRYFVSPRIESKFGGNAEQDALEGIEFMQTADEVGTKAHVRGERTLRLFFPGFMNTEWSAAYLATIERIASDVSIERESDLDHRTMVHIVTMSLDHAKAKFAIADSFLLSLCESINATFGLGLIAIMERLEEREIVARYEFGQPDSLVSEAVNDTMKREVGIDLPSLRPQIDHLVFWLIHCLNALRFVASGSKKNGDFYADILEAFEQRDIIHGLVKDALDEKRLLELLERPLDAIAASRSWAMT